MSIALEPDHPSKKTVPSLYELYATWLKIGVLSFGGPAAQIALMHRIIVDEKAWLSEKQFLNGLSFCMLLPGPEAMQLATYSGWRLYGVRGGLVAGALFVVPGALVVALLAAFYVSFGDLHWVNVFFLGIKAAVVIIVIQALYRVATKSLQGGRSLVVAGSAFIGIFFLDIPFPIIVILAGVFGYFGYQADTMSTKSVLPEKQVHIATVKTVLIWCAIWAAPVVLVALFYPDSVLLPIGLFFSKLAVVTFGGAYALLVYLGQEVVNVYQWLTAREMMDGLGLAETTPGPLILVTEFVGFIAGFRDGGFAQGVLAALMTLWVTFVPCFLWIFAGAPYLEWISEQPKLKNALSAITAAVVGVILNLSVWFALHVWFESVERYDADVIKLWLPALDTINIPALVLTATCALLVFKWKWGVIPTIATSSGLALLLSFWP